MKEENKPNILGIIITLGAVGTLLYYSIKLLFV